MVYSPSAYIVSTTVTAVALQMQQASASSLFYEPFTVSETVNKISNDFPGFGADVADQNCAFEVEADPTLPDITTISRTPVELTSLLANTTTAPSDPVSKKVGTMIMSEEIPTIDADQDAYIDSAISWSGTTKQSKQAADKKPKDCTTGWEETTTSRKLRHSTVAGRFKDQPLPTEPPHHPPRDLLESTIAGHFKDQPLPTQSSHHPPRDLLEGAIAGREKDQSGRAERRLEANTNMTSLSSKCTLGPKWR